MNRCEQENRLTPFLLGDLSERDEAEFSRHLAGCAACQDCARELSLVLKTLADGLAKDGAHAPRFDLRHQLQLLSVPAESTHRVIDWMARSRPWLAAAACALIVTGLAYAALFSSMFRQYGWTARRAGPGGAAYCLGVASESAPACAVPAPLRVAPESTAMPEQPDREGKLNDTRYDVDVGPDAQPVSGAAVDGRRAAAARAVDGFVAGYDMARDEVSGLGTETPVDTGVVVERELGLNYAKLDRTVRLAEDSAARLSMKGLYADRTDAGRKRALQAYGGDKGGADESYSIAADSLANAVPSGRTALSGGVVARQSQQPTFAERAEKVREVTRALDDVSGHAPELQYRLKNLERVAAASAVPRKTESNPKPADFMSKLAWEDDGAHGQLAMNAPQESRPQGAVREGKEVTARTVATPEPAAPKSTPRGQALDFNPFVATGENRFSTFSIAVNTASYSLTRQAIRSGALPDPDTVRTEELLNVFDYGDAAPDRATFRIYVEGAPSAFGAPGLTLLRIGVKGKRLGREEHRPAILTFLVDTSGSMAQPDRIGRARTALRLLLDQLSPRDQIQLVSFDDKARLALPPTAATRKDAILNAFDRLQCNGSTNLEDGMRRAYEQAARAFVPGGENRVILISDGVANLGADNAGDILKQVEAFRKQGVTCSVFGVGEGTYNDAMLEDLANKGQGVYRFLDSDDEARRVFVDELSATLNDIATDVKIQVEWSAAAVRRFRQLGYERRALTAEQFRDDTVEAGAVGSGQSVTALYELDLSPAAKSAPLGIVRVRYRRVDTGAIEEIAQVITPGLIAPAPGATRPQFRLAMGAAAFAELLRGTPYVVRDYADVARLLRPVAQELSLDPRVKELLALVEAAAALSN
ncbi:MAG: von Willebrand factor type A domain-containing protein [bacterium]